MNIHWKNKGEEPATASDEDVSMDFENRDKLLPLPAFLARRSAGDADRASLEAGFLLSGYFLERHVFDTRGESLPEVRLNFLRALSGVVKVEA